MMRVLMLLATTLALLCSQQARAEDQKYNPAVLASLKQLLDLPKAEKICASGKSDDLCGWIGLSYLTGTGVAQDVDKGRKLIFVACGVGSAVACAVYEADNAGDKTALREMQHPIFLVTCEAERGAGTACFNAAQQLWVGYDVKQNKRLATDLYLTGCEQGHGKSCGSYAQIALQGDGIAVDMNAASITARRGCELDNGTSCAIAIMAGQSGKIDPLTPQETGLFAQGACGNGVPQLCDTAASHALQSLPDAAAAAQGTRFAKIGCDAKRPISCGLYARTLLLGLGVAKDEAAAMAPLEFACTGKHSPSCYSLGVLAMRADQTESARKYLNQALAINPAMAAATAALARLDTP